MSASHSGFLRSSLATWLALIGATLLSYLAWLDPAGTAPQIVGSLVILIAMGKAWLIGMRFMELGAAPWPLRMAYVAWILVVGAMLLVMLGLV